ncbi:peptidoglycan DD-metalloendopeptidase family protein [Poseidonibacter antarcticus]|uniref:peptidoglycan DD-metalloendopeptidase family protein n=1 Tax=Poseidonibacter antarcticus TaxID=2478538 RepID=UPI000EF47B22|nr:peptidoglycan DD-metalloendopeptidase family protein [Poseidonibacter antarcticus]
MKKIILSIIIFLSFLHSAEVKELSWPKGESFLTFLEKYSIPQKLYFDLEKEDKELCSEIVANRRFYLYTEDDGTFNQVLIPVSEDIQIHIYQQSNGKYKFQTLPINYKEYTESIAIPITKSVSYDIKKATGDVTLAIQLQSLFKGSVDFRKMRKGDFIALKYTKKSLLGRRLGLPEIDAAMVEVRGKKYYRIKNKKDDKYYNEKAKGFTKTYFFRIPLTYKRISSKFTRKRWHPVLKRYRAHLGTDFAAPRGRKIYAAANGTVEFKGRKGGYGNTIIINHHNGYKTLYAHQNGFKKGLRRGQKVKKGQHIGYVGTTGLSSGPHLHLGLYKNGNAIDPMKVIKRPKTNGLKGQRKVTFIANAKKIINQFEDEITNGNKTKVIKLDRIAYKSDLKKI